MSIQYMDTVWRIEVFSDKEKLVMLALADNANDDGICWPSWDYLLKKCGIKSKTTLSKYMKILEDVGLIEIKHRGQIGEGRQSNLYTINMDLLKSPETELMEKLRVSRDKYSSSISPETGPRKVQNLDPISTELGLKPSLNPHSEPSLQEYAREKFAMHSEFMPFINEQVRDQLKLLSVSEDDIEQQLIKYRALTMLAESKRTHQEWSKSFVRALLKYGNQNKRGNSNGSKDSPRASGKFDAFSELAADALEG